MSIELWIFGLTLLFLVVLYFKRNIKKFKLLDKITGPPPLPIIGNALAFGLKGNDHVLNQIIEWNGLYGQRYKFFLGSQPYIVLWNALDLEKVMGSQAHIEKSKDYELMFPWLGTGLLTSTGKKWHSRRKMLTPAFHFKILEDFLLVMNEQAETLVQVLGKLENKGTFNIFPYVTHAALDIICETAMGRKINAQLKNDSEYVQAVYRISELIQFRQMRPWLHPNFIWKMLPYGKEEAHVLHILHSFTNEVIQAKKNERRQEEKSSSNKDKENEDFGVKRRVAFLDLLLDVQEKDSSFPDDGIREETDTFMFEGHDTTAANVNWTIFLLGLNPDAQAKVHEEMDEIFGDDRSGTIRSEDLAKMKYLEICIKESLRIYPSVPFIGRSLQTNCQLDSETIVPAGSTMMLFPFFVHRDPEIFPDPETFLPERFLAENSIGRHPFAYIPFSAGPRNCIGQKFSMMEEKVLLANVFRNFRVESMESQKDVVLLTELILRPRDGLKVQLFSRK